MGLAMRDLWSRIEQHRDEFDFEVSVSCLEVYNETLRDLFVQDSPALDMREDPQGCASVAKLSVQRPSTVEEVQRLLAEANARRRQSPTDANAESSRSHAVFQVTVTKKAKAAGVNSQVYVGKLSLIDLAGSERAAKTNNRQERLQEGANINRSLLALANCINALGANYRSGQHIPFRNSKLTRLLKDSLGGTCRTTMIANISPSTLSYEDTLNTLKYASRTKNIKINASRKVINVRAHLGQYKEMIETLNGQVALLRARLRETEVERANCRCLASNPEIVAALEKFRSLLV
jgi:kinesin family protein 18/19